MALPHAGNGATKTGQWLILADSSGVGERLAERLETLGNACRVVRKHEAAAALMADPEETSSEPIADWPQLLAGQPSDQMPLVGVVHLWSLDAPTETPEKADGSLETIHRLGCRSMLELVQNIVSLDGCRPRLWVATRGSQLVNGSKASGIGPMADVGIGAGDCDGAPRARIGLRRPGRRCPCPADALLAELFARDGEDQIACG